MVIVSAAAGYPQARWTDILLKMCWIDSVGRAPFVELKIRCVF